MGLFNKGAGRPEYENKPYEWFLSEEGKQSYLKYAENWKDMDAFLVEVGAWDGGFEKIAEISSDPVHHKPYGTQQTWPCHFFCNFLKAGAKKFQKDKQNPMLHYAYNRFTFFYQETGIMLYFLSLMIPDDLKDLKWPDFLTPEFNPFINYIHHIKSSLDENLVRVSLFYIHEMINKNINVSEEEWMYDENTYLDQRWELRFRDKDEMYEIAIKSCKYPDVLRKIIYG